MQHTATWKTNSNHIHFLQTSYYKNWTDIRSICCLKSFCQQISNTIHNCNNTPTKTTQTKCNLGPSVWLLYTAELEGQEQTRKKHCKCKLATITHISQPNRTLWYHNCIYCDLSVLPENSPIPQTAEFCMSCLCYSSDLDYFETLHLIRIPANFKVKFPLSGNAPDCLNIREIHIFCWLGICKSWRRWSPECEASCQNASIIVTYL